LSVRLLLSAGEPSGDLYAGALTRELQTLAPGLSIRGLAGPEFAAAGGTLLADYMGLTVTGFTAIPAKLPRLRATMARLAADAAEHRPDALIVIDFFGFNARLARRVKALGVPVVYYVSPQIWAWRRGRLDTIRRIADRVLVIFPFEETIYREAGVPVEFVGHPLVDLARATEPRERFLSRLGLAPSRPTVAMLPGSRPGEVRRILGGLALAADRIRARVPDVQFVVARAPNLADDLFEPIRTSIARAEIAMATGQADAVLASADVVVTASGTATVQAALHDVPMVVVYRLSPFEYRLGKPFVAVNMYAMVNLIAGERIVPELIQNAFTPEAVAEEATSMLTDPARAARIREGLRRVRERLGGPGASRRAAEAILRLVGSRAPI